MQCGVEKIRIECIIEGMMTNRLQWFDHLSKKCENDWMTYVKYQEWDGRV